MGIWMNNFVEFERKQKRENRLVLNFYYLPDKNEEARSVKVFVSHNVLVPTCFLTNEKATNLEERLKQNRDLSEFQLTKRQMGKFNVFGLELSNNPELLHTLPYVFQTGNYDKLLRFGGFFPERKVQLSVGLERLFLEQEEVELDNLNGIEFGDLLSEQDIKTLSYLVIDIEKPLWKNDDEKRMLSAREKLLRLERKYGKISNLEESEIRRHERRLKAISSLEEKLTIDVSGVGRIALYDDKYRADVSSVTTIWGINGEEHRETYILDSNGEFNEEEFTKCGGYNILRFKTEKELVVALLDALHKRKPLISYGHNQVYDITQLRFAAESSKQVFDPVVKEVKPRRDFVRQFLQRLREDLIYFDTLWLSNIFSPYLKQKRFGTSLKLADVAKSRGIDFEKSQSHEDLRFVELRRLSGQSPEIRRQAMRDMLKYAAEDVDVTEGIVKSIDFIPLITGLKRILPFCTLTEVAFSTNCMNKLHEYRHFRESGNLSYFGYRQKQRQDELQIFKKRFPVLKKEMLKWAFDRQGVQKPGKGEYQNVSEFYVPFEEWMKDIAFRICPDLMQLYNKTADNTEQRMAFLQFLKAFERDIFADYYFARREEKNYLFALNFLGLEEPLARGHFSRLDRIVSCDLLGSFVGSFKYLKNHFRSIYVPLNGEGRRMIFPSAKNLATIDFPAIMQNDADLFLLKARAEEIRGQLSPANKRKLITFLNNFDKFEAFEREIERVVNKNSVEDFDFKISDLLYTYVQKDRTFRDRARFYKRYGFQVDGVKCRIANAYDRFAKILKNSKGRFLEQRGDYIFVEGAEEIPGVYLIRRLKEYSVE